MTNKFNKISRKEWNKLTPEQKKEEMHLFQVSRETFRRRLLISTRIIAIFLILAIAWFGWVQLGYKSHISHIYDEYGPQANCYLCGLQQLKSCSCNYFPNLAKGSINSSAVAKNIATSNIQACNAHDSTQNANLSNISDLIP